MASKGTVEEHKAIVQRILETLDKNNRAVKWGNALFSRKREWLAFKISEVGVRLLVGKTDALKNLPISKNIAEHRSFFGSINQFNKTVPNLSFLSFPL